MTRHPVLAAVLAFIALLATCAVAYVVGPLAGTGAAYLPLVAGVALVTALAGTNWGLVAFVVGAALPVVLLSGGEASLVSDPALQFALALYAVAAVLVLMSTTLLRWHESRLDAQLRLHDEMFDRQAAAMLRVDAGERVMRMNRCAERLTGWRESEARGKPLAQILRLSASVDPATTPAEHLAGESGQLALSTLVASDGSEHSVVPLVSTLPPPHGDGGRVILLHDAGAWMHAERELRRLVSELWQANRQKDETIAALSARRVLPRDDEPAAVEDEVASERSPDPPLAAADPDTQPVQADAAEAPGDSRVLMLSDDTDSAFALSMLLGLAGYDVQTALSAPEALSHAARFAPKVALIDTEMADTDGLAAARALRMLYADLELVALTPTGAHTDHAALAAAGYAVAVPKSEPLALKRWLATRRAA